jgi:hypothetical protein
MRGKVILVVLLAPMVTSCVHDEAVLVNDRGEKRYCYADHNTSITSVGAVAEYNKCLNEAGVAGFRRN